ncbi:PEGA domain-containing protein [Candidatus Shapirobacteria bacterium]|nr:PEGA domain-containing protein [Candidatus Shapirobacteria bacterium]
MTRSQKRVAISLLTFFFVVSGTILISLLARGYRPDFQEKGLKPTGLLVVNSLPKGAQVFINGQLTTATNQTINLPPGEYRVTIKKPGYSSWEKNIILEKEVVTNIDAYLFPLAPDLKALTFSPTLNPLLSPDGTKLIYFSPGGEEDPQNQNATQTAPLLPQEKGGVWLIDLTEKPLGRSLQPRVLVKTPKDLPIEQIETEWSPDSRQILLTINSKDEKSKQYFLLEINQVYDFTLSPLISTPTAQVITTLDLWEKQKNQQNKALLKRLPEEIQKFLEEKVASFSFSPDESKVLYQAGSDFQIKEKLLSQEIIGASTQKEERAVKKNQWYVYDLKEDKNFLVLDNKEATKISWFPTSLHLLLIKEGKVEIEDYDGKMRTTVYAGPFDNGFVFPLPSAKGLLILTSLNNNTDSAPNLYSINFY